MSAEEACLGYAVRVVTKLDGLRALSSEWEGLWQHCVGHRTPFLSYEWVLLWSEHYQLDGSLRTLVVTRDSRVVAIVPLTMHRYSIGPFSLNVVETPGEQSRNLIGLVVPGMEQELSGVIAGFIDQVFLRKGVCLRLLLVPSDLPLLAALAGAFAADGHGGRIRNVAFQPAPYAPLPISWQDYLDALSRSRRKMLQRAATSLGMHHDVCYETCGATEIRFGMEELYRMHQERWHSSGIRGLFADKRAREFHTSVALALGRRDLIRVYRMCIDGEPVSIHFVGVLDGVLYLIRSGRDIAWADYDVGHLHEGDCLKRAIMEGLSEADFLRGAEPYKYYWTKQYRMYNQLVVSGRVGPVMMPVGLVWMWLRISQFLEHRHTPRELAAILRIRRREARERKAMRVDV
ncbi:MAG: GNAT family N-acetyltransferase [Dehalococcoidia bacterium]|nr:GNAT family N-acetyltransferase [Dehalococcoidia bacterium]